MTHKTNISKYSKIINLELFNYLKFLRMKDWFYIIGLAFLGFFYEVEHFEISDIFPLLIIASLYLAHGYSINSYFGFESSQSNFLDQFGSNFNLKMALFLSSSLFIINCGISFFYSKLIFILVILGGIISFLYSSSYTRLKFRPFSNIILNSTGFSILFLMGYLANKPFSLSGLYLSGYIWLGIVPSQIIHLMAHKPFEKNWPFSSKDSLKLFYLFCLIWACWSFILYVLIKNMVSIFVLTLLFCIAQTLIIEMNRKKGDLAVKILKVRNEFKVLNGLFGALLLTLFVTS